MDLHLEIGADRMLEVRDPQLVVAGYTGRDPEVVRNHVEELQAEGVPPPMRTPSYWLLPSWLLSTGGALDVSGGKTSGEAEPVLIAMPDGELFVTVGSDHTDRELERVSLHSAKHACPKILGSIAWSFDEVADSWDDLLLTSHYDGAQAPYQFGKLELLLPPGEVLAGARLFSNPDRPLVVFLGTVPLRDGFHYGSRFTATLSSAENSISCSYSVRALAMTVAA